MIAKHSGECPIHSQDLWYGLGFRVINTVEENGKVIGGRCTVCAPRKESNKKRGGVYPLSELQIKRR